MFDEPSRQRGGSPPAAAAGKFAPSWTEKKKGGGEIRLYNANKSVNDVRSFCRHQ